MNIDKFMSATNAQRNAMLRDEKKKAITDYEGRADSTSANSGEIAALEQTAQGGAPHPTLASRDEAPAIADVLALAQRYTMQAANIWRTFVPHSLGEFIELREFRASLEKAIASREEAPVTPSFPFHELRFIMRVLGHKGTAPKEDWATAYGMARQIFEHWHLASRKEAQAVSLARTLRDLLEDAYNGLKWYRDAHPEDDSPADDELYTRIDAALAG